MAKTNGVYEEFIRLSKALQDAEVPEDNRVMYYLKYSWWRHPIKRFKQWQTIRKIVNG